MRGLTLAWSRAGDAAHAPRTFTVDAQEHPLIACGAGGKLPDLCRVAVGLCHLNCLSTWVIV